MKVSDLLAIPSVRSAIVSLLTRGFKTRFLIFTITISGARIREVLAERAGVVIPEGLLDA